MSNFWEHWWTARCVFKSRRHRNPRKKVAT